MSENNENILALINIIQTHITEESKQQTEILTELRTMNKRQTQIEDEVHSMRVVFDAFAHNEDGDPDLVGHRECHSQRRRSDKSYSAMKVAAGNKLVEIIVTAFVFLLMAGLASWIGLLKIHA